MVPGGGREEAETFLIYLVIFNVRSVVEWNF